MSALGGMKEQVDNYIHGQSLVNSCEAGSLVWVKKLIEKGVDPRYDGDAPVVAAMSHGHMEITQLLIETYDADPAAKDGTGLAAACGMHNLGLIDYLLKSGCDPNKPNGRPLQNAADAGSYDAVKLLLEHGADVTHDNYYALYLACSDGFLDIAKMLVAAGADIHCRNDDCFTVSVENNEREVAFYFFNLEPDYYTKLIANDNGLSSVDWLQAMLVSRELEKKLPEGRRKSVRHKV